MRHLSLREIICYGRHAERCFWLTVDSLSIYQENSENPLPIHHVDFQILLSETPVRKIPLSDWFVWPAYSFPTVWSWPHGGFLLLSLLSVLLSLELVRVLGKETLLSCFEFLFQILHLFDRLSPCCQVCVNVLTAWKGREEWTCSRTVRVHVMVGERFERIPSPVQRGRKILVSRDVPWQFVDYVRQLTILSSVCTLVGFPSLIPISCVLSHDMEHARYVLFAYAYPTQCTKIHWEYQEWGKGKRLPVYFFDMCFLLHSSVIRHPSFSRIPLKGSDGLCLVLTVSHVVVLYISDDAIY